LHKAVEDYEKSNRTLSLQETQEAFKESYVDSVAEQCEETPNFAYWFWSGPYDGRADIERRWGIGLEQVEKYLRWAEAHPEEEMWITPDGVAAVELPFTVEIGGVEVRGVIDQVLGPDARPRDVKSGNKPGNPFQLGTYGMALRRQYGVQPETADFWMGKTGKPTKPVELADWPDDRLGEIFAEADDGIRAESFDPDPEPSKCYFCQVRDSCAFSM
jgi:putative RecB family exonuclease